MKNRKDLSKHSASSAPKIQLFPLDKSPGKLLYRAGMVMRAGLRSELRAVGLSFSIEEWAILSLLWERDNMTQLEIVERVEKDRPFVSRLLDSLERKGLVQRKGGAQDRRVKRVLLTSAGRNAKATLSRILSAYMERTFAGFSQAQFDNLMECLELIVARHRKLQGWEAIDEEIDLSSVE